MAQEKVSGEVIEKFLEGHDPQKYIVGIEAPYHENKVSLIINDPEKGKYIEKHKYKPFIWLKHQVAGRMYGGNKASIRKAMDRFNVTIKALTVEDGDGNIPKRMENGYKYIATCNGSPNDLIQFFKQGGVEIYGGKERLFMTLTPPEQFMIQTGKRLFKGMDDYDDIHRFQFDLETEGLDPLRNPIFQVGMKDNRGFEMVIEVKGDTEQEKRDSERDAIKQFFEVIDDLKPDVITGYNSENFDWAYFYGRCERLYINIEALAKTLNPSVKIKRKSSTLKLGQETEYYEQTYMWGYNIIDIFHAVRKAQAINSDIKQAGLKYITKFSGVAKKNRVYVAGDMLHTTWSSTNDFYFNDEDGEWFKFDGKPDLFKGTVTEHMKERYEVQKTKIDSDKYKKVKGDYIVQRYLLDDLWETEQIDAIYNQASFLLSKIIPTSYMRSSTMGTAGTWKLIMMAWSYENTLAIPDFEVKRSFTGGLARLLEVGFARKVGKLDYAALYPKTTLTWSIFPELDISGVMNGLLTYVVDTRDEFKFLAGDEKDLSKKLKKELNANRDSLSKNEIDKLGVEIKKHGKLASDYDKKQLPLKILANSFFGSFGAPHLFNWGDTDSAEEITCRGRQYLRLMVRFFHEKYGFRPLVGDTDGFNFAIPDNVDDIKYICKADHWKTSDYEVGQELTGMDAVLAEFNETLMEGRMGLDIDDICNSTINFARKNYANDIDGKIKLVGNSVKSKTMPRYIEEFLDKGIRMLLDGEGHDFIEYYYDYVDKIYNYNIPLVKIASKKRIKQSIDDYVNTYCKTKTKAGTFKARQAHMELAIKHELDVNLGDTIYYVNVGDVKSHGDIKTSTDSKTGKKTTELRCKLIPSDQIENNPNLTTNEYNVPKYLAAFNKRIHSLLVCFNPEIRDSILIDVKKDKKTKEFVLDDRPQFTKKQCGMDAGNPFEDGDQDSYEDLMTMEDKEIRFWSSVDMIPNHMEESEWLTIEIDWKERMVQARINGIRNEKNRIDDIFMRLEVDEIESLKTVGILPKTILAFAEVGEDKVHGPCFFSIEWDEYLCNMTDIFKYEEQAKERNKFYIENPDIFDKLKKRDNKYDIWMEQMHILKYENGLPSNERFNPTCTEKFCCAEEWDGQCPCYDQFDGDKDKLNAYIESQKDTGDVSPEERKKMIEDGTDPIFYETYDEMNTRVAEEDKLEVEFEVTVEIEQEILDEQQKRLNTKVGLPPDHKEPKTFEVTMKDVDKCEDCDEDEWNF